MEPNVYNVGGFNFPASQCLVPPPAPYLPPGHGHALPFCPSDGTGDAPQTPGAPTRKRTGSDSQAPRQEKRRKGCADASSTNTDSAAAAHVEPAQEKRKRGRPHGSAKNKVSAAPAKSKTTVKANASKKANQENIPPPIEPGESDDEIERAADGKVRYWMRTEKTRVFDFILAATEKGEQRFIQHKTNPMHVYKRASEEEFNGDRSPESVKSMFERSLKTFGWIRAFEDFTGNGGGDADSTDPTAILKGKLNAARKGGRPIGGLTPSTILDWEKNGWYDLFNYRFGTSAKVSRVVVRNSAAAISHVDSDSGNESDGNIDPNLRERVHRAPRAAAATVSEPKHTPSSTFRKRVTNSFGNLGELMKMKMAAEEKKASVADARLIIEREKLEMDKTRGKVEMAQTVLSTAWASDQQRAAFVSSKFVALREKPDWDPAGTVTMKFKVAHQFLVHNNLCQLQLVTLQSSALNRAEFSVIHRVLCRLPPVGDSCLSQFEKYLPECLENVQAAIKRDSTGYYRFNKQRRSLYSDETAEFQRFQIALSSSKMRRPESQWLLVKGKLETRETWRRCYLEIALALALTLALALGFSGSLIEIYVCLH
ncbi:hypothetical protein DFH08DRAFT_815643 [Mycena albidolilacea]|uniref:Uncharacterized protein n=1 Tax=Mycena albidolilacea TaxID=1033008 RepID=A0AAD7EIU4_9AGAR|nr:hypothetical protein DFH08DRAFT_815643 [Mycena albidolilacea]